MRRYYVSTIDYLHVRIHLSPHAKVRMRERGVTASDVRRAITNPDRLEQSLQRLDRFLVKKVYMHRRTGHHHLLLIVYERRGIAVEVITVIDTSKIAKYL
jgi:hypothetical protein